jgi:hypothetical protein
MTWLREIERRFLMSKILRIVLVLGLVGIITWLAGSSAARAGVASQNSAPITSNAANPALASLKPDKGSVRPPPPPALIIRRAGSYSAGGFCLIRVEYLSPEYLIEVQRSYYSGFGQPLPVPDGIFLSAVCRLLYYNVAGFRVSEVPPDQGSVQICFAAIPNRVGDIYIYSAPFWTDLLTSEDGLLACSPANQSGFYVRRGR